MDLLDKTFLITGASSGIGLALATELAKRGARLILVARSKGPLKAFTEKFGDKHNYICCDFNSREGIKKLIDTVHTTNNHLDVLVNAAGIGVYKNVQDISAQEWDSSLATNLTAPFLLTQGVLDLLQKSSASLVLNIGSGCGVIPMKGRSAYCATKFALRGWSLSLSEEFKNKNPRYCLITLGSTLTGFGGMTIEEKKQLVTTGRAYFPVEWVATKLVEIIKDDTREDEVTLFPSDYGFGEWKKP